MIVSWTALKAVLVGRAVGVHGTEDADNYYLMAVDAPLVYECVLPKSNPNADLADFENNYKPAWNTRLSPMIDGYPANRPATTKVGWHYCPRWITWTTAKYNSLHNNKVDGTTDWADAAVKYWTSGGTELKRVDYLTDLLFQAALLASCTRTTMDWHSTFDFDIVGSIFLNGVAPTNPAWGYVIAAPDIPAVMGGSIPFLDGGFPLHLLGSNGSIDFHGITVKRVVADAVNKTNKFRLMIDHETGVQLTIAMGFKKFNL